MLYPNDVLQPVNAKNFGFVDPKLGYNSNWDIVWSFTYALTGSQHGFCTFLTKYTNLTGGVPGHYMGYSGNMPYILSESGDILLTESGERLVEDTPEALSSFDTIGVLGIAFDSTGLFALSGHNKPGVSRSNIKPNSLIIRDSNDNVIFNETLSSLDSTFILSSSIKVYNTLRFILANSGRQIIIDYKNSNDVYKNLLTIQMSSFSVNIGPLYPGLTFCTPISSSSIAPSTFYLQNFHTQGNTSDPTFETLEFIPLTSLYSTIYTTISGISAYN